MRAAIVPYSQMFGLWVFSLNFRAIRLLVCYIQQSEKYAQIYDSGLSIYTRVADLCTKNLIPKIECTDLAVSGLHFTAGDTVILLYQESPGRRGTRTFKYQRLLLNPSCLGKDNSRTSLLVLKGLLKMPEPRDFQSSCTHLAISVSTISKSLKWKHDVSKLQPH